MIWHSTKTYGHEQGLSCAFRQWRTDSHCSLVHGYALAFSFEFMAYALDERNWVMDFGGLKEVKAWLKENFDHTLAVAADDPELERFLALEQAGLANVKVFDDGVGCEKFAEYVFKHVTEWLQENNQRVMLTTVECREHAGNSAVVKWK